MNEDRYSDLKKIGLRIREIRLGKKMSQADLAVKAHLSLPQISDIERGKSNMMLSTLSASQRLCKFLPIPCCVLTFQK